VGSVLSYAIPGIPYGCTFALLAVGLVLTFRATGVFNLAFGAQAFVSAFAFDLLEEYQHWPEWASFVVAVLVVAPAIGLLADRFLFRYIPTASTTAKLVAALALFVAIPQVIPLLFGDQSRYRIGYLWLSPSVVEFHLGSSPVNGAEVSTVVLAIAVSLILMGVMKWTNFGMTMRSVVESRRLAQLQGVDSSSVEMAAWALSSAMAGLAGVLLLPETNSINPTSPLEFTTLLVAGITAAAIASFDSIPVALIAGIGLGVVEDVLVKYMPPGSTLANGFLPSFPFIVLVLVLLANPRLRHVDENSDPMANVDPPPPLPAVAVRDKRLELPMKWGFRLLVVAFLVSCLTWVPGNWVFSFNAGLAFSTIFLSIVLLTGMSGQLSLCQATFAGIGAFAVGQLAQHFGTSVFVGALAGAAISAVVGTILAVLVIRVSGLLLTLVTLAFALFADQVLFQFSWIGGGLAGVTDPRPAIGSLSFANGRVMELLSFVVLLVCSVIVLRIQRGTMGHYLAAMRGSPTAACSLGINLSAQKIMVFALAAGIAGIGGALYGSIEQAISPNDFQYVMSLVFVVVVITTGVQTVEGAIQAGMAYTIFSLLLSYLPSRISGIEIILFALGALTYVSHPEGIVEYQRRVWLTRVSKLLAKMDERRGRAEPSSAAWETSPTEGPSGADGHSLAGPDPVPALVGAGTAPFDARRAAVPGESSFVDLASLPPPVPGTGYPPLRTTHRGSESPDGTRANDGSAQTQGHSRQPDSTDRDNEAEQTHGARGQAGTSEGAKGSDA
jgi:branched-subunit amino acid ABC-type transport system permease component